MAKCMNSPNFLWKIENYSSVDKKVCPAILIGGLKWQLAFSKFMENGFKKIRLVLECLNALEILSTFEFKVEVQYLNDEGRVYPLKSSTYKRMYKELCAWSETISNFRQLCGLQDDITFLVMVTPVGKPEDSFKYQEDFTEVDGESLCNKSLTEDLRKLFNNDENSDFVLNCGEKSFNVHKAVLSTRSDYFSGMFRSNMDEANKNFVNLKDLEPDVLELVLIYIYTGKIPKLRMETLKKVYVAADRLAVDHLKIKCQSLFVDTFITDHENDTDDENDTDHEHDTDKEDEFQVTVFKPGVLGSETLDKDSYKSKEKQLLKELFMTREWRVLSEEFPHMTQEMCRPLFLQY